MVSTVDKTTVLSGKSGGSVLNLSGGEANVAAGAGSTINISGGQVQFCGASGSEVNVTGGTFVDAFGAGPGFLVESAAFVDISGGNFGDDASIGGNAVGGATGVIDISGGTFGVIDVCLPIGHPNRITKMFKNGISTLLGSPRTRQASRSIHSEAQCAIESD